MTPAIEVVDVTALTARVDAAGDAVADARWAFDRCPCDRHNVELLGAVLAYKRALEVAMDATREAASITRGES